MKIKYTIIFLLLFSLMQAPVVAGPSGLVPIFLIGAPIENAAISYVVDASLLSLGSGSNYWGAFFGAALLPLGIEHNYSQFYDGTIWRV